MKKSLIATLPVAAFVAGMAAVPNVFAAANLDGPNCIITDQADINTAFSTPTCQTVTLGADLQVKGSVTVSGERTVTLDLNGKSVVRDLTDVPVPDKLVAVTINVTEGANLTITDSKGGGKVLAPNNTGATGVKGGTAINIDSSTVTLDSGTAIGYYGDGPDDATSVIQVKGTKPSLTMNSGFSVTGGYSGIVVLGEEPSLTINGGSISVPSFAISGNGATSGNNVTDNTTINIKGGTIESTNSAAIYHPQKGTTTISGGTIKGKVGIVARQGTINITGGSIVATGDPNETKSFGDNEVELPLGVAAIVDDETAAYAGDSQIVISQNTTINATNPNPVLSYNNPTNKNGDIIVEQGVTFSGTKPQSVYLEPGLVVGPNNVVMTEAEAEKLAEEIAASQKPTEETPENPDTADSIVLYATIATVALLGLGSTALVARKFNR